jgi:nitrate reductase gamma subunit
MEEMLVKAIAVCGIAICFGGFLIRRGATGDIWRSRFTGDAVVPAWLYIAAGALTILGTLVYIAISLLLAKS